MREVQRARRALRVKTPSTETPVRNLSGGNLQKLVLGREFQDAPPAHRGAADARARRRRDRDDPQVLARGGLAGVAILLISEDLDEVRALADGSRDVRGAVVGELDGATATVEQLGYLMAGGRGEG